MILMSVHDVAKYFGPDPVLDGVTFEVRKGERIGLVGPNGAGKTTLLSILVGEMEPDRGAVHTRASATLGYLRQHAEFDPARTVWDEAMAALAHLTALSEQAEDVAHQMSQASDDTQRDRLAARFDTLQQDLHRYDAYQLDHKIERVLLGLGFEKDGFTQPVGQLSGGQQNRLLLAQLLLQAPDVMLLDEPSNHLDIEATQWLETFLSQYSGSILLVSHDRYFLDRVTNRTLELFHGTVDDYKGNFTAYWQQKAERLIVQQRTYEKQQESIAKTEDFIRRNHYGQKSAQAEDRRKKLARIQRVEPPREIVAPPMAFPNPTRSGDIVLRAEALSKGFAQPLFEGLTFDVLRGERWGILGPNGTGKTTLLRCLIGEIDADSGTATQGTGVEIGYFDQGLLSVAPESEVIEAIRPSRGELTEPQRRDRLARFGLTGDVAFQTVESLSGGERTRAALTRLACEQANVLILDEPTNHLDLWARDALERALLAFQGTVLFVTHDRYFLNRVADHLLVVEPGRFFVFAGNYEDYLHLARRGLARGEAGAANAARQAKGDKSAREAERQARPKRKFPYLKIEDLEREIHEREAALEELNFSQASPEVYRDGEKMKEVKQAMADLNEALARLYEHWEEATELN